MKTVIRQHLLKIIWSASVLFILVLTVLVDATGSQAFDILFTDMDKVVHFLFFGLMAYFCITLLYETRFADPLFLPIHTIIFIGIVGMVDELIQSHTPGRSADLQDVAADITGAIAFLMIWYIIKKRMPQDVYDEY